MSRRGARRWWPRAVPTLALLLVLDLAACSGPPTAREDFEAHVLPVLQRRCVASACHGVAPDAEARGERIDWDLFYVRLDARGLVADADQAYAASRRVVNAAEAPELSTLLRKPLAVRDGGLPHFGGAGFSGPDDPAYQTVRAWIAREDRGGEDPAPLSPLERQFADTVQPVLVEATCMTERCHGPTAGAIPYRLDVGMLNRFSIAATRHNHQQTLAMVALDGYPLESRLLRKSRPLDARGIVHKGENFDFYAGNPGGGVAAVVDWICAERRARTGLGCASPDQAPMSGFVFVRGPVAPRHTFDLDEYVPGSDLFLATVAPDDASLAVTAIENLTAPLHPDGPVDVRDPAVSRDGARLLFAMRTSAEAGHHIWVLDLETRAARQLTSGNRRLPGGGLATDRDPTWGPDGTVWFVSTRAGVVADQGQLLDAEIYSLELAAGADATPRRWTHTPHVERKPVFFDIGDEAGGELGFSVLRDALPGAARAHIFRFPPDQETEYHQHFGITPIETLFYDMRELPDGRYVTVVGELPAPWGAGRIGVVDRNFGPEINAAASATQPALEAYTPPLVLLPGDGAYRDPAPLPDGRVLVSYQAGPFDPADANAPFTPRIAVIELEEARDRSGPTLARLEPTILVDEPGVALTDPEPIAARAPIRCDGPALAASSDATALLHHQGLPMIDALLANLPPSGVKPLREDIAYVRLVEHLAMRPAHRSAVPAQETSAGTPGATSAALGRHGPARVLAELPVAADGSFQARVPVGVPFRLQALDASRMAVGVMHNRWYYLLPGQTLVQGLSVATGTRRYGSRCAACHGDPEGVGGRPPELEDPDALTTASLTLSRYERQDPRRPIAPPLLGSATQIEIDFRQDVQPILDRRCARLGCHTADTPAGGLDLGGTPTAHFSAAYEGLLSPGSGSGGGRAYVDDGDGRARTSYLVELVTGREMDAPRELPTPGTPHPAGDEGTGSVDEDELLVLIRWIELGATFLGGGGAEVAP